MTDPATASKSSTDVPRLCLTAVDEAPWMLLSKRLARALLLEAEAGIAIEAAQPRLDSTQPNLHS